MRYNKREIKIPKFNNNEIIRKIIRTVNTEGFYLVLFICFCIVAAATVWTVKVNIDRLENINSLENKNYVQNNQSNYTRAAEEEENIESAAIQQEEVYNDNTEEVIKEEGENIANEVISNMPVFSVPVQGTVCLDYTKGTLIYSKTLDQYIVHSGIDIEAPLNSPVSAAADGVISKVEETKDMGITIWISHKNNITTVYSNLSTAEMVETGQKVKKGDVISGVGDTALFETIEVPHLHFEVIQNNKHQDPKEFLSIK